MSIRKYGTGIDILIDMFFFVCYSGWHATESQN